MKPLRAVLLLSCVILVAMLGVTSWASSKVAIWNAGPDVVDPWTIATLFDAYAGFLFFFAWTCYKERTLPRRIGWFVGIMLLGNIAMSIYLIKEIVALGSGGSVEDLLLRRNG